MKKFMIAVLLGTNFCLVHAQIALPENKSMSQLGNKKELPEIAGYGKYNATVIGYAISCNFPKEDNKLIYEHYFKTLDDYSLTADEKYLITKQFDETIKMAKDKGVANNKMTCETFKPEFEKIVSFLKNKK